MCCHWLALQIQSLALSFIYSAFAERHISIVSQSHSYMTWTWEHCSTPDDPSEPTGKGKEQLPMRLEFTVARKRDGTWISHVRKLSTVVNSSLRRDAHNISLDTVSRLCHVGLHLFTFVCIVNEPLLIPHSQLPTHDYFKGNITICVQLVNNETLGQCLYFSLADTKSVVYPTWTLALFQQALLRTMKWFSRIGFLLLIWNRISLLVWLEVLEHFFFSEDQSYTVYGFE